MIDNLSAALLASEFGQDAVNGSQQQVVTALFVFGMAGAQYALPMSHIVEVQRLPSWTRLPGLAAWALGATNLRGEVVSVIDPLRFFKLPPSLTAVDQNHKLIVVRSLEHNQRLRPRPENAEIGRAHV